MEIRLLGPVEAYLDGARIDLGGPRARFVLGVLALQVNKPVPLARLVELNWPVSPPRTASHGIVVCVSRLRQVLAVAGGAAELARHGSGYLLRADPLSIDAYRFGALVDEARDAPDEQRIRLLDQALQLWTGRPLDGCAPEDVRDRLCRSLDEARLVAIEDRLDAKLRSGSHRELLQELSQLVADHPLRERLTGQLMLALHRNGRSSDALAAYRAIRARLVDELGIDPGRELQSLERAILRDDAALAVTPGPPGGGVAVPVPAQLPSTVAGFAGRQAQLKWLDNAVSAGPASPPESAVTLVIAGSAGVGKTALAVTWAHRVAEQFPDGQLYLNLRGFDPVTGTVEPAVAVRQFLDTLGAPADRIPTSLAGQTGLYRSLLAGRRMLIVLDNAGDEEHVRPLLPGTAGCLTVVTSRNMLNGLIAEGAHPLVLGQLDAGEAHELLAYRLTAERVAAEPDAVAEIIARCARLPLALAVVAARAAVYPDFPLAAVADELRDAAGGLDAFDSGDLATDLRAVFTSSYLAVSEPARRLFRLLSLHPGPDATVPAAASLAGLDARHTRRLLAELTRAHLLAEPARGRYVCHDLLRAYAAEQTRIEDDDDTRHAALHRLFDHLLHSARAARLALDPHGDPMGHSTPVTGAIAIPAGDRENALAWFTGEHRVLLAAANHAGRHGFDRHAWQLCWALTKYLHWQGHWHDQSTVQRVAIDAARRCGDRLAEANAVRNLAVADALQGHLDDAYTHNRQALELFAEIGDRTGQADVHMNLAWVTDRLGRSTDAARHSGAALELYRAVNHRTGQARALNEVAWSHAQVGDYARAAETCLHSLAIYQELEDLEGEASVWDSLGYARLHLGDWSEAVDCYRRALDHRRRMGDRHATADTLVHLGEVHATSGDLPAARAVWHEAAEIYDRLTHPDAELVRAKLDRLDT